MPCAPCSSSPPSRPRPSWFVAGQHNSVEHDRTDAVTTEVMPVAHATPLVARPERTPTRTEPLARSTAQETVATAEASTTNVPGQCLAWSREQADIPSRWSDTADAWEHARGRRAGDPSPPPGAAVYWTGGSAGYGHVAISVGHGMVRSTDAGGAGVVGTVPLAEITTEWGLTYAGWADSINGYRIPGVAAA